jgi:hypothetical protein
MNNSLKDLPLLLLGGLLIGLGCAGFFALSFSIGQLPPQARFLDIFVPLVVLVFMLILIRARRTERSFHFWEGLVSGNVMLWIGGLISGLLIYLLAELKPELFENFTSSSIRYLIEFNKQAAANQKVQNLDEQIRGLKELQPSSMILDELWKKIFYSFFLVPLVSIVFRRK